LPERPRAHRSAAAGKSNLSRVVNGPRRHTDCAPLAPLAPRGRGEKNNTDGSARNRQIRVPPRSIFPPLPCLRARIPSATFIPRQETIHHSVRSSVMATVKSWKVGQPGAPYFPADFEIVKKAVLQVTDIKNNNNKYYAIELHRSEEKGTQY